MIPNPKTISSNAPASKRTKACARTRSFTVICVLALNVFIFDAWNRPTTTETSSEAPHAKLTPQQLAEECYVPVSDQNAKVKYDPDFEFKLKVPFFVYENELNWENMTSCGQPLGTTDYPMTKHSDDYWMYQSALQHPMRTMDPEQAKLFFVPLYLNAIGRSISKVDFHLCVHSRHHYDRTDVTTSPAAADTDAETKTRCFIRKQSGGLFKWADEILGKSIYFQRSQGRDHVLVSSHYVMKRRARQFTSYPNLLSCNRVVFENFPQQPWFSMLPKRIEMPSLYVANNHGCAPSPSKSADFVMIASMKDRPTFKSRHRICRWLSPSSSSSIPNGNFIENNNSSTNVANNRRSLSARRSNGAGHNFSVSLCGEGPMCPTLAQSRFGFHPRGDTLGSNRLADTIMSETIPIFTEKEQYDIVPDFVPFHEIGEYVDVSSEAKFLQKMDSLSKLSDEEYDRRLSRLKEFKDLCDFTSGQPFDAYMAKVAREIGLQE